MYFSSKEGKIKTWSLMFVSYLLTLFAVVLVVFVFREDFNSLPADGKATLILNCMQHVISKVNQGIIIFTLGGKCLQRGGMRGRRGVWKE